MEPNRSISSTSKQAGRTLAREGSCRGASSSCLAVCFSRINREAGSRGWVSLSGTITMAHIIVRLRKVTVVVKTSKRHVLFRLAC